MSEETDRRGQRVSVPIPEKVTHVEGCDCDGGLQYHRPECAIFSMDEDQRRTAIADARRRMPEFAQLTEQPTDQVHLVVMERGGIFGAYLDGPVAHKAAKAIGGVIVTLPITADYRPSADTTSEASDG